MKDRGLVALRLARKAAEVADENPRVFLQAAVAENAREGDLVTATSADLVGNYNGQYEALYHRRSTLASVADPALAKTRDVFIAVIEARLNVMKPGLIIMPPPVRDIFSPPPPIVWPRR